MKLHLVLENRHHLTKQIYQQLRAAILEGRLKSGEQLPPTRELAQQLDVSRNTVVQAYDLLMSEGLLTGTIGSGSYINEIVNRPLCCSSQSISSPIPIKPFWQSVRLVEPPVAHPDMPHDFSIGLPAKSHFPFAQWRSISASRLRYLAQAPVGYGDPQGMLELREAIAKYIAFSRAVRCQVDNIIVTNGAKQAFNLIARVLLEPGDVVAVEEPGYTPARQIFASYGVKVVGVPVDEQGLMVECLLTETKLIYVTPSHQFPLGMPLSLERRLALLEWATKHNAVIVEDDYDSEFRFEGRPLESLQNLDRAGRVFYVGTFSKVLFPEIRLGFIVAPMFVKPVLVAAKQLSDAHSPLLTQATLTKFIEDGHLAKHIRKMDKIYAERRDCLLKGIQTYLSDWMQPIPSLAGLHTTAVLRSDFCVETLIEQAATVGVKLVSLASFYDSFPTRLGLVFGYGVLESEQIESGLIHLNRLIAKC